MPEITLPDVNLPELHRPDVHLPEFNWSGFKRLDLKAPDVHLPEVSLPKVDLSKIELPDIATLKRLGRPARRRNPIWPWAIVATVGLIVAGWWLTTSAAAAPRMRKLAWSARKRIENLRGTRRLQEGADGEAAAAGWTSDQDWHESAESGPARDEAVSSL